MRKQLTAVFMAGVLGAACVAMAGCGQEASPAKADTEAVGVTETAETTEAADTLESEKAGDRRRCRGRQYGDFGGQLRHQL